MIKENKSNIILYGAVGVIIVIAIVICVLIYKRGNENESINKTNK